jgi:arylsulfatase A-like enzyme
MTNIVLLTVDALRADHLHCLGHPRPLTPRLDALAEESLLFTAAFANGPNTPYSLPALLLSRVVRRGIDVSTSLPRALRGRGYRTAAFNPNPVIFYRGAGPVWARWDQHFDHYDLMLSGQARRRLFGDTLRIAALRSLREGLERGRGAGRRAYRLVFRLFEAWLSLTAMGLGSFRERAVPTGDELNARALNWLAAQKEPFFVWVHYMDVHDPYLPAQARIRRDDFRLLAKHREFPALLSPAEVGRLRWLYEACVREVDTHIGAFLDALDASGKGEKSLVILASDHGEAFGEHGDFGHGQTFRETLYDELLRVPLVVRGLGRRGRVGRTVQLLDLAPTACEAAGIDRPAAFRGRSLLEGGERGVVSNSKYHFSYRTAERKIILNKYERGKDELYDLEADPGETRIIAAGRPQEFGRMRRALLAELRP